MTVITPLDGSDGISPSKSTLNTNFSNLNSGKVEVSDIDTDNTLAANSDSKIASQKAVRDFVISTASPVGKSWNEYAASSGGTDSYAITVAGVTAYVTGQTFKFKADVANTGACTLNVNGLGAKTIKKNVSTDLSDNDIKANQIATVMYDGTNMQIVATPAAPVDYQTFTSSGTWTKPSGAKICFVEVWGGGAGGGGGTGGSGASGGGGGGYAFAYINASTLSATETVTIGSGGTVGASAAGGNGGNSVFASKVTGYGGGGGANGSSSGVGNGQGSASSFGGGGGGGTPTGTAGTAGGAGAGTFGGGAGSVGGANAGSTIYGGGGGGGGSAAAGSTTYGGGGGGGAFGTAGSSIFGGAGGAGSTGVSSNGTAGTAPSGGGGGGGTNPGTSGGLGARGEVRVTTFF